MSIDPVPASSTGIELQNPEKKVHAASPPQSAISENAPPGRNGAVQTDSLELLFPEHEVKVQLVTSANDAIVYQVFDKQSGALVLQVPSAAHIRGIQQSQELLQRIASRGRVPPSEAAPLPIAKGEANNNGNKL